MAGAAGLAGQHLVPAREPAHEVGQSFGRLDRGAAVLLEPLRPLRGVRRLPPRDVPHAVPHDPVGHAAPDAVGHAEGLLDQRVHQVVREIGAATGTPDPEDDTVVPLDQRLDGAPVGHPLERDPHASRVAVRSTEKRLRTSHGR
jgi:hypothetical protein